MSQLASRRINRSNGGVSTQTQTQLTDTTQTREYQEAVSVREMPEVVSVTQEVRKPGVSTSKTLAHNVTTRTPSHAAVEFELTLRILVPTGL